MFYKFAFILVKLWAKIFYRYEAVGKENIPKEGSVIFCANHTRLTDPIFVGLTTNRVVNFLAKKELFEQNKIVGWTVRHLNAIPVHRDGHDLYSLKVSLKKLKNGEILGIFPEGRRVHHTDHTLNFKPGVAIIAIKAKARIVPMYIQGDYKVFHKMRCIVGEPFDLHEFYGKKLTAEEYEKAANEIIAQKVIDLEYQSNEGK